MNNRQLARVINRLSKASAQWRTPIVTAIGQDPFRVLISCILSLRTRDEVTDAASVRLFKLAADPESLLALTDEAVERAIYPAAFYRNKAKTLKELCRTLLERHAGRVPDTLEDLLALKGVGRKTANLTLILGHGKPGICVDTHVHRISNRWGYVRTDSADATEMALRAVLPKRYWMGYNDLLVRFGQNVCKPVSPLCSQCCIEADCPRIGVGKHR